METPIRIEIEEGREVVLSWEDGETTVLSAETLRAACQCATCREEAGRRATERVLRGDEPVRITEARLVGAYAVNFVFAPDGHHTGIYPFERLRAMGEG